MADSYKVRVRVVSQKGSCEAGHKLGDQWIIGDKTPEGLCPFALNALMPLVTPLMFGASFPWEKEPDMTTAACPDADNPVVFELRRLPE
jgi:uncharacterized repeat protein (TIGR04076 family)